MVDETNRRQKDSAKMDEDESDALYDQLVTVLKSRRDKDELSARDDYLTAVLAEIDAGKAVQVKLKVPSEHEVFDAIAGHRTAGSSSADFIQRQDFSGVEKLEILIRGIETSVIAPARMAAEINRSLEQLGGVGFDGTIYFGDDILSEPTRTVTPGDLLTTLINAEELEALIGEVRISLTENQGAAV